MLEMFQAKLSIVFLFPLFLAAACSQMTTASPIPTAVAAMTNITPLTASPTSKSTNTPTSSPLPTLPQAPSSTFTPSRTWTPTVSDWQATNTVIFKTLAAATTRLPTVKPTVRPIPELNGYIEVNFSNGLRELSFRPEDNRDNAFLQIVENPNDAHDSFLRARALSSSTTSEGKHRVYPTIYYPFREGNYAINFDVRVTEINPRNHLGDWQSPWLSLASMFDESITNWRVRWMIFMVGKDGKYKIVTRVFDDNGDGYTLDQLQDAPTFQIGKWTNIRVDVDVKSKLIYTYQDGHLVSTGTYLGLPGNAGGHFGLYGPIDRATVDNDNIVIGTW